MSLLHLTVSLNTPCFLTDLIGIISAIISHYYDADYISDLQWAPFHAITNFENMFIVILKIIRIAFRKFKAYHLSKDHHQLS